MAITIDEPTFLENFLYYGLFLGAIFQMACIAAVIFIPQSENEEELPEEPVVESKSPPAGRGHPSAKKGKKEKKKQR